MRFICLPLGSGRNILDCWLPGLWCISELLPAQSPVKLVGLVGLVRVCRLMCSRDGTFMQPFFSSFFLFFCRASRSFQMLREKCTILINAVQRLAHHGRRRQRQTSLRLGSIALVSKFSVRTSVRIRKHRHIQSQPIYEFPRKGVETRNPSKLGIGGTTPAHFACTLRIVAAQLKDHQILITVLDSVTAPSPHPWLYASPLLDLGYYFLLLFLPFPLDSCFSP